MSYGEHYRKVSDFFLFFFFLLLVFSSSYYYYYSSSSFYYCHPQKVEAALIFERQRVADLLAEQKKKALTRKSLVPTTTNSGRDKSRLQPRYDFGELRHHQRRCAAMLFGARKRGAHKLPILVGHVDGIK